MPKLPRFTDILLIVVASAMCGAGCGFVNGARLGLDSVGIFYDGIRSVMSLSPDQIGTASYVVCFVISVFLWFANKRYVSIGSIIYILLYGFCANLGTDAAAGLIGDGASLPLRCAVAVGGLLILYLGLGIFIAVDIGVDAFTGLMLWICDVTGGRMDRIKVAFDLGLALLGILLGGTFGVFSVITILAGGFCISFITKKIQALYFKHMIKNDEENL
jgi:hypothetical protein